MPCGCKKKGSGGVYLSGATWKRGRGMNFTGSGYRRKRKKKASGMSFRGSGMNFTGSGYVLDGSGYKALVGHHKGARRSK